jgi:hypothetical protein
MNPSVLHNETDVERGADVAGGIARHGDDVGETARHQAAQLALRLLIPASWPDNIEVAVLTWLA